MSSTGIVFYDVNDEFFFSHQNVNILFSSVKVLELNAFCQFIVRKGGIEKLRRDERHSIVVYSTHMTKKKLYVVIRMRYNCQCMLDWLCICVTLTQFRTDFDNCETLLLDVGVVFDVTATAAASFQKKIVKM